MSFRKSEPHNYSWATVRLYYSVFYACKAYLACKNVAIVMVVGGQLKPSRGRHYHYYFQKRKII